MAVILHYLFRLRSVWRNALVIFRFRSRGCKIGSSCQISGEVKNLDFAVIKDYVNISHDVSLSAGVLVGNYSALSRIAIGENSHIDRGVLCTGFGNGRIVVGKECYIGINNILDWSDNIVIGDFVHIAGPSTGIWTHSSAPMCRDKVELSKADSLTRPVSEVIIESQVYIGGNCTIYPGVTIGHHAIVAPNSAVIENVEPYTMVGGVPAKLIKSLR